MLLLLALLAVPAHAAQGGALRGVASPVSTEALRAAMLDELMGALGHSSKVNEGRLEAIEAALGPMYRALHKNEYGHLDHAGVRYALHRLFVLRHGMFIKGLEPGGAAWTGASSPTEVLGDHVPAFVQGLFEEKLDGRGLGLHEVALLAATLEHLVHDKATEQLRTAYMAAGAKSEEAVSGAMAEEIVDMYMSIFLMGTNSSDADLEFLRQQRRNIQKFYPSWPESQKFTRQVQKEVMQGAGGRAELSFNATTGVVEAIMDRYGKWQDQECQDMKKTLMGLEDGQAGRVPLKNFYGKAKGGMWQFTESVAYLRDLGALDETDPQRASVLVPNYVNSHSNCLASSSIYSVCCLNECEPLLGHLEKEVGEPDADVDKVLDLVRMLPSSTEKAPREVPAELRSRLSSIAEQHGGKVPLHGRLFGQWLHHMYPRECPFPHLSGTTNPMTPDEWITENGRNNLVSRDEMAQHMDVPPAAAGPSGPAPSPLMWTAEEELVVLTTAKPSSSRWRSCLLSSLMALAALGALAGSLWTTCRDLVNAALGPKHGLLPLAGKVHAC